MLPPTLRVCPDCGGYVSKRAAACPKCGRRFGGSSAEGFALAAVIGLAVVIAAAVLLRVVAAPVPTSDNRAVPWKHMTLEQMQRETAAELRELERARR